MLSTQLSADDQALLDQMRDDDAGSPGVDQPETESETTQPRVESESETTQAPPAKPPRQTMVPHQALHEEREVRKASERKIAELSERYARLEERTNLLLQRAAQPEPAAEAPIPELATDPVGHFAGRLNQTDQRLQAATQQTGQQQQQITQILQQQAIHQAVTQRAQSLEREFETEHPDYGDAVKFVSNKRFEQMAAIGVPAEQRAQQLQQEGFALAVHAMQNGRNPADLIYSLAQTYGYAPVDNSRGNSGTVDSASQQHPGPQPPAPAQRLQNIAAGQQQGRSLSQARGTGPVPMTAQRLLEMTTKEFDAFQTEHAGEFRDIMGR